MANTYELIEARALTTTTANITFSSIPQTYTDLEVRLSARNNESDNATSLRCYFNGDTGNITVYELRAIGTSTASYSISYAQAGYVAANSSVANSFGIATIYIPNYTGSLTKASQGDIVQSTSTESENYAVMSSRSWNSGNAITSVTLASGGGSWLANSNFYLYGIKKN
jgi:hypothetical protein